MRKSKHELNLEHQLQRTTIWATTLARIFKYLFSSAATAAAFYFIFLSIDTLAGDTTHAKINVVFELLKNQSIANLVPWMVCGGGVIYGLMERRIRIEKTKRLARRIKMLENTIDMGRQSSRLDRSGNARREDA